MPLRVPPSAGNNGVVCGIGNTRAINTVGTLRLAHLVEIPVKIPMTRQYPTYPCNLSAQRRADLPVCLAAVPFFSGHNRTARLQCSAVNRLAVTYQNVERDDTGDYRECWL